MFDPAEQEWTELTGMVGGAAPLGRRFHGLAAVGDQLYIFGGYNINLGGLTPAHAHTLYTRKHTHTAVSCRNLAQVSSLRCRATTTVKLKGPKKRSKRWSNCAILLRKPAGPAVMYVNIHTVCM